MDTATEINGLPEVLKGDVLEGENKTNFWAKMHHGHFFEAMQFEAFVFGNATKMCSDYNGGMWEFVVLDDDKKIYYIYPKSSQPIKAEGILNHANEELDPRVFGIIVTLLSLAWRGEMTGDERYFTAFHNLRGFVDDSLEGILSETEGVKKEDLSGEAKKAWAVSHSIWAFLD